MYMTQREKDMQEADKRGYRSYGYYSFRLPQEYADKPHLETAFRAGWKRAEDERMYYY